MSLKTIWLSGLVFVVAACASPTNTPNAIRPSPTVAIEQPSTLPPTDQSQPTEEAAIQPTLVPTELNSETPTLIPTETPSPLIYKGTFVNMEVPSAGTFKLDPAANTLTLNEDFTTRSGPDLYVILSGTTEVQLHYLVFSQNVTNAPIQYLGTLTATSGSQTYTIPAGTDLAQFHTVVIWCKTYSVAFAAALIQ
jgi:hypothetical protein